MRRLLVAWSRFVSCRMVPILTKWSLYWKNLDFIIYKVNKKQLKNYQKLYNAEEKERFFKNLKPIVCKILPPVCMYILSPTGKSIRLIGDSPWQGSGKLKLAED